jgi:hypothetical protein
MSETKILIALLIMLLLIGCSSGPEQQVQIKKVSSREQTTQKTPEQALVSEISSGKLVEVYEKEMKLGGARKENWMIIKNAREAAEEFNIIPCDGCAFDAAKAQIEKGQHTVLKFYVATPGEKEIIVKDRLNNAYGSAKISVTQ